MYSKLAARPAPIPNVLVGVLTEMKMISAAAIASSTRVENCQIAVSRLIHHLVEPRLVDRQLVGIPSIDSRLIQINDVNFNLRTLLGDHRHCGTTDVTGTDAADFHRLGK